MLSQKEIALSRLVMVAAIQATEMARKDKMPKGIALSRLCRLLWLLPKRTKYSATDTGKSRISIAVMLRQKRSRRNAEETADAIILLIRVSPIATIIG